MSPALNTDVQYGTRQTANWNLNMRLIRDKITDLQIVDESDLGSCCNNAIRLAEELGFSRREADNIAAVAANMIHLVVSHGCDKGRFFVCRVLDSDSRQGLEMWSCDNGDAITDVLNDVEKWSLAQSLPEFEPTPLQQHSDEFGINPDWWPDFITVPRAREDAAWMRIFSRKWMGKPTFLMG